MNKNPLAAFRSFKFRPGRFGASLLLGMAFGLSVYNYFLVRVFPPTSRRSLLLLAGLVFVGACGYFLLLDRWIIPRLSRLKPVQRGLMLGSAVLLGGFLMLAGTESIEASPGSTIFLLPGRTVQITAPGSQLVPDPEVVLLYLKTSTGGIPFTEMEFEGWTQEGNQLILSDFSHNSLRWTGKPGREASFVFQGSSRGGYVIVDWGGFSETVNLQFDRSRKYVYAHEYPVPLHASGAVVLLLLAVNFIAAACALLLFLWEKRSLLAAALAAFISPAGGAWSVEPAQMDPGVQGRSPVSERLWIIGIMLGAFLLRVLYLGRPYVYIDEFAHMDAAKALLAGQPLAEVYQRGLYIVTLPVAFFIGLFGPQIWAAKLPGVLVNVLAILPLYLLVKKVAPKAAIFSCVLFAISPWIIAVSRSIREYAYYPFYFYWVGLAMILFLERVPEGLVILKDWRKLTNLRMAGLALALILPIVYSIWIDSLSTFRIIAVMYPVFLIFLTARLKFSEWSNLLILGAGVLALGAAALLSLQELNFVSLAPGFNSYSLRFFFPNPEQQWYFDRMALPFALAFAAAILVSVQVYRRNFIPLFIGAVFLASMLGFMLFFSRFVRPRYLMTVQFWFVPLIGFGLYLIWSAARILFREKRILWAALLILAALSVNGSRILMASSYDRPGVMPITDEYQYNFRSVDDLLLRESRPGDVLVGSFYAAYASWTGRPVLQTYRLDNRYKTEAWEFIEGVIAEHDSGWLVLDDRYDRGHWPLQTLQAGGKTLEYLGSLENQWVWKWQANP